MSSFAFAAVAAPLLCALLNLSAAAACRYPRWRQIMKGQREATRSIAPFTYEGLPVFSGSATATLALMASAILNADDHGDVTMVEALCVGVGILFLMGSGIIAERWITKLLETN